MEKVVWLPGTVAISEKLAQLAPEQRSIRYRLTPPSVRWCRPGEVDLARRDGACQQVRRVGRRRGVGRSAAERPRSEVVEAARRPAQSDSDVGSRRVRRVLHEADARPRTA